MGMVYQFKVAKRSDIPADARSYEDHYDKFFNVGSEMDRAYWVGGFVRSHDYGKPEFCRANIEKAIADLRQLDEDVKYVLESASIGVDVSFRRRLADGLVSRIYGYRDYHYPFPKCYYKDDDYNVRNWTEDDWKRHYECSSQSNVLKNLSELLPYANGDYVIWLEAY